MNAVLVLCTLIAGAGTQAQLPNIVFMMADDMGMGDTSVYQDFTGNKDAVQLHAPQMERLARMGIRFTDAHTPSSRCTPTRYALMTGRYAWRNRMKHWVLFGAQGDPMIEADRPTIASLLRDRGYATAICGKWHVGLRYRRSDGRPAAGYADADFLQPLHTTPLDHGFDLALYTTRSAGTSGNDVDRLRGRKKRKNNARKTRLPGHLHGRRVIAATGRGKGTVTAGAQAYSLSALGKRNSDNAIAFLDAHVAGKGSRDRPFFLYYPAHANHSPYTPSPSIDGVPVAGAARTKAGQPMNARHDFIFENDVALGRLIDWLESTVDPRDPKRKLIKNTLLIFTSDNGAEINSNVASGPFRSHKGSAYEGGHRVPFMACWPAGGVGNGHADTPGVTSSALISLTDMYATFAELTGVLMPDHRAGEKGGEDSVSILEALKGGQLAPRAPLFFNDHKEARDRAASAIRIDNPLVNGKRYPGQWKLFFSAELLRQGIARPYELYNLAEDPWEATNLLEQSELKSLIGHVTKQALLHRTAGGHHLASMASPQRITFDWRNAPVLESVTRDGITMTMKSTSGGAFTANSVGLGIIGGDSDAVDSGEALIFTFDRDVIIESTAIVAGQGACGGFYRVGNHAPLAIYCVDADIDAQDQSGILSDIGVLKVGQPLRLDSSPHYGVEAAGEWRLRALTVRGIR